MTKARKKTEPVHPLEQKTAWQHEQAPVQLAAPQAAYQRAQLHSGRPIHSDLLLLQRTVGNHGVQRILARRSDGTNDQQPRAATEEKPGFKVQIKRTVSAPGNIYKQAADQVMRMSESGPAEGQEALQTNAVSSIQRSPVQRDRTTADPLHQPIIDNYRQWRGLPPGGVVDASTSTPLQPATIHPVEVMIQKGNRALQIIQRTPTAPSGLTRDPAKLKITTTISPLNYFEFIRNDSSITVDYTSDKWSMSSKWSLFDPRNILVNTNSEAGGGKYDLTAKILRKHVDPTGTAAFGTWTLRYEKGDYFDDLNFDVTQAGGPGLALTDAEATPSFFNLRELPGEKSKVIGKLSGTATPVMVSDKAKIDNRIWYKITLKAAIDKLAAGTQGWVIEDGVVATVPWNAFLDQVRAFEKANSSLSLDQRITKLRQMSHKKDLPFDSIIGTAAGNEYLDTRSFNRSEWQILEGSLQTVRVPDGSKVDIYHLMVGLDVLPTARRVEKQTYWNFNVGQNYAAATWSGDIGAGAADAFLGQDKDWEKANSIPAPGDVTRTSKLSDLQDRYYSTRAPESDLLGDIDAWGIDELRSDTTLDSLEKLLVAYYGGTSLGPAAASPGSGITVTTKRKSAVERFLRHYGFKTASPLKSQTTPRADIAKQIGLFAAMWIRNRDKVIAATYSASDLTTWYVEPMTDRFINWLDALAQANGASV